MIKKIQSFFKEHFYIKRFFTVFRLIVLVFLLLVFVNINHITLSRYNSEASINVSPDLAFFVTDVGTHENKIALEKILPQIEPYIYVFTVSNHKDDKKINVNLEYNIEFVATTNLPLNFKVFKNTTDISTATNAITKDQIITNEEDVYFRVMTIETLSTFTYEENQTDTYILWVEFPDNYKYQPQLYEGVIDLIEIKVNAKQKV